MEIRAESLEIPLSHRSGPLHRSRKLPSVAGLFIFAVSLVPRRRSF